MQPRHRWPAAQWRPRRRSAGGLAAVALALLLVLLTAPAALAAQPQSETVPGGSAGTRVELLTIGLGAAGILLVGGLVLVLINRPQRSRVVEDDEALPGEDFPEGIGPEDALAYPEMEMVPEDQPAYYGEPVADEALAYGDGVPDDGPESADGIPDEAAADDGGEPVGDEALAYGEAVPEEDADAPRPALVDPVDERLSGS
jgi:hypothetical protein